MKKLCIILLLSIVSPIFAADFTLGRYASADGPIDSLPGYPGLVFTNYFEFRQGGVMLVSATTMGQTVVAAATYKVEGTTIISTDSEAKITVFDIQKDGSLICQTWPWEGVVLKRVMIPKQ